MRFSVSLCDTQNVAIVKKFIDCVKKTKPDCTIMQDDVKVKTHKMLLQVFSDNYTDDVFNECENTVIVLYNHSPDAIKTVITDLLYDAKVVVDEDKFLAVQSLCNNLGIKFDATTIWDLPPAIVAKAIPPAVDSKAISPSGCLQATPKEDFATMPRLTRFSSAKLSKTESTAKLRGSSSTPVSSRSTEKRHNTLPPMRFRTESLAGSETSIESFEEKVSKKRRLSRSKSWAVAERSPSVSSKRSPVSLQRSPEKKKRVSVLPARYRSGFLPGIGKLTFNKGRR